MKKIQNFFIFHGLIHEIKNLIVLGSVKNSAKSLNSYLLYVK